MVESKLICSGEKASEEQLEKKLDIAKEVI